jgi:hypothetical protein
MKSLHAEVDPKKNLYSISNPLVVSKLDTDVSSLSFTFNVCSVCAKLQLSANQG